MANQSLNIYQTARKVAGYTQEKAAELLNVSVESLRSYESGNRVPPNDVVAQMVDHYNSQIVGIQHLRSSGSFASQLIPEVADQRLPESVMNLIACIYDFADIKLDRQLINIAKDGIIDETERPMFDEAMKKINNIIAAAMAVRCNG
jgi:transcriptional regulator with XRE-family HTH domain